MPRTLPRPVILRSGIGPTVSSSPGPAKIVCDVVLAPPGPVFGTDEKDLPGKLQDVLVPAGWGQKKLELAGRGHFDFVGWDQESLVESAETGLLMQVSHTSTCPRWVAVLPGGPYRRCRLSSSRLSPHRSQVHSIVVIVRLAMMLPSIEGIHPRMSEARGELRFDGNFQPSDVLHRDGHHWRVREVLCHWKRPQPSWEPGADECYRLSVWGPLPGEPKRKEEFTMKVWGIGDKPGWRLSPGPGVCVCRPRS
jgi:hypothetical protein